MNIGPKLNSDHLMDLICANQWNQIDEEIGENGVRLKAMKVADRLSILTVLWACSEEPASQLNKTILSSLQEPTTQQIDTLASIPLTPPLQPLLLGNEIDKDLAEIFGQANRKVNAAYWKHFTEFLETDLAKKVSLDLLYELQARTQEESSLSSTQDRIEAFIRMKSHFYHN